ncbi:MAG: bifunctional folylpolyglutamate synthase/dihydrofolate synthase, partial [Chromatiales bacterium]|nr:bifunctional folylpolyglutamate synthase/dihydrofolate synthase [Chromatiales bacterium]
MKQIRFERLQEWLDWQERLHPTAMDLGLERVKKVVARAGWPDREFPLVIVAGTNGKGSSVAYLEQAYVNAGYRVGTYTSPHLIHYNERIRIDGRGQGDAQIMDSFVHLDAVRGDITLTYFEFGTLAAMDQFHRCQCDIAVMEVGIGGRLDAVNVFDADVALITTVDIDHQKWLGDDRESIGWEKVGIARGRRPTISAERCPPHSVRSHTADIHSPLFVLGDAFDATTSPDSQGWTWTSSGTEYVDLPLPVLPGAFQLDNAAGALMVLECLSERCPVSRRAVESALRAPQLQGRFQVLDCVPQLILDVAHNPQATEALAMNLAASASGGRTLAVAAM